MLAPASRPMCKGAVVREDSPTDAPRGPIVTQRIYLSVFLTPPPTSGDVPVRSITFLFPLLETWLYVFYRGDRSPLDITL